MHHRLPAGEQQSFCVVAGCAQGEERMAGGGRGPSLAQDHQEGLSWGLSCHFVWDFTAWLFWNLRR